MYRAYVRKHGIPDIIHAHSIWNGGLLANAISSRYKIPFVLTEHSTAFSRGRVKPWQARWGRKVVASAGALIAVSDPFCSLLGKFFGNSSTWRSVPNIVDERFLDEPLPRRSTRDRFLFLSIAYMEEKKNQEALVRAFAEAFSNDSGVGMVLAGDGPLRTMLESLVRELGLKHQIQFTGMLNRAEVVEAIKHSDAFVLPSKVETFGVVVVEALALGVPVVVTVCGGPESFVSPRDGLVVPSMDIGPLAHAMRQMVMTRHEYVSEEIRARCGALYSGPAVVRQLNGIYAEVLRGNV
jgi:glycosyltransferase involved in cell wall biosynthesis